eukprot:TRINITY_DN1978_c0_g1::TRINITY_DN1978_c0_g1_i2::g.22965::m.22965 TRINITY_DN1978_c0_g1::TRINITY_DN1978_c0_g1_i2::g.22965  ORF type:complete len:461 (+),score=0.27,sp/Q54UC9/KIF3_DICDI/40.76/3e-68,Kinesin/PF00225.18/7.7e-89,DUF1076/PF06416.7/0.0082 TRINITY_DN1978_c0_g1_i2:104-1486(+)
MNRERNTQSTIRVVTRVRPPKQTEETDSKSSICHISLCGKKLLLSLRHDEREFIFDRVIGSKATQEDVYRLIAKPIVEDVLLGYNGALLAYGQTGSGKTHTMFGPPILWPDLESGKHEWGVILRSVGDLFEKINSNNFLVHVQFCQLYLDNVQCLLDRSKTCLALRETPQGGVFVEGLTELEVTSLVDFQGAVHEAIRNRSTFSTSMNSTSSRSHAILSITVDQVIEPNRILSSTLRFVDLAGSERVSKSLSEGTRLEEAKRINRSLATLGKCIIALARHQSHIPFRESKLTRLLSDCLGSNSKTCICGTVSPDSWDFEESISTLTFLTRAMNVATRPVINENIYATTPGAVSLDIPNHLDQSMWSKIQQLEEQLAQARREANFFRNHLTSCIRPSVAPIVHSDAMVYEFSMIVDRFEHELAEHQRGDIQGPISAEQLASQAHHSEPFSGPHCRTCTCFS